MSTKPLDLAVDPETAVLTSIADGRLDRPALYALPALRCVLLARIAHRAGVMDRRERDEILREFRLFGEVTPPKNLPTR